MVLDHVIEGRSIRLRSACLADVEFTYNIRQDKEKIQYLHQVSGTLKEQEEWLTKQRERQGDYFFVVETKDGEPIGTTGVCNMKDQEGEGGRFILYGNPVQTAEASMLGYDFAFYECGLKKVWVKVHEDNTHIHSYVRRFGAKESFRKYDESLGSNLIYFYLTEEMYREKREKIMKSIEVMLCEEE